MIDTVVFDFNGTLFLDSDYHLKTWVAYCKLRFNKDLSEEEFRTQFMGKPNVEIIKSIDPFVDEATALVYSEEKEKMYRDMVVANRDDQLVEGAIELFNFLKQNNIAYTIASAANESNFEFYKKWFHLDDYFDPNLLVIDNGMYKDKVEMYGKAIELLHGKKDNTLIIEDSRIGIDCALAAGVNEIVIINTECIDNRFKHYQNFVGLLNDKDFHDKIGV